MHYDNSLLLKTFDVLPCKGSTLEDISLELFKLRYLPSAIDADTLVKNGNDLKSQLASFKFYDLNEDCPTYAGILMFGTNPRFFIPGASLWKICFKLSLTSGKRIIIQCRNS